MPVKGKATPRTPEVVRRVAEMCQCEPAVIDAILRVEAADKGFDDNGILVVRPEAGVVANCPLLTPAQKTAARKAGFFNEPRVKKGQLVNDVYWDFIDGMARQFGDEAAYWCSSFGAPQIMGFNYRMVGYDSARKMVLAFADSEDAQIEAMGRYLRASGMVPALKTKNWKQIARLYNGPAYRENAYDTKLEEFYHASDAGKDATAAVMHDDDVIQFGDHGEKVKAIQTKLRELGYYADPDGDFGPETKDQVMAFQRRSGLTVDGRVDVLTHKMLFEAPPKPQNQKSIASIAKDSHTVQAGAATVTTGAVAVVTAATQEAPGVIEQLHQARDSMAAVRESSDGVVSLAGSMRELLTLISHHMLFVVGISSLVFGGIAIWRRIRAQRLRKVG